MHCPNCGKKIPDDSNFCPECGQPVDGFYDDGSYQNEQNSGETQILSSGKSGYQNDGDDSRESGYPNDYDDLYGDYGEQTEMGQHDGYQYYPERNGDGYENPGDPGSDPYEDPEEEKSSVLPVVILIIAAAAAVLAVFGIMYYRNNIAVSTGTESESAVESNTAGVNSKTESRKPDSNSGSSESTGSKPSPTGTAKPTVTPTPTPTNTPAPTVTAAPTSAPTNTANDYIFPDSATVPLSESDLAGKSAWDLTIARNEICARHGYIFNRTDLQTYFNSKSWYQPVSQFNLTDVLTTTELNNMVLIDNYQNAHGLQTH